MCAPAIDGAWAWAMGMALRIHAQVYWTLTSLYRLYLSSFLTLSLSFFYKGLVLGSVVVPRVFVLRHGGGKMDQMATVLSLLAEASQREQGRSAPR